LFLVNKLQKGFYDYHQPNVLLKSCKLASFMPRVFSAFIAPLLFSCLIQTNVVGQAAQNPQDTGGHRTFAMIMGISTYKFIRPLSFADSDAELFRDFLRSGSGGKLPDSNIYFLKNEEAKAANFMVKGMSWLRNRNLKAGDRLYIYLAVMAMLSTRMNIFI
jgi:hypothetical protein